MEMREEAISFYLPLEGTRDRWCERAREGDRGGDWRRDGGREGTKIMCGEREDNGKRSLLKGPA